MSYCRWSTDDFNCDLYVYESCHGGWQIHVAGRRHDIDRGRLPDPTSAELNPAEWAARHQRVMDLIKTAELVDIGGPYDGESYNEDTPGEAANRVEMLAQAGYNVPDYVAEALRQEQEDIDSREES